MRPRSLGALYHGICIDIHDTQPIFAPICCCDFSGRRHVSRAPAPNQWTTLHLLESVPKGTASTKIQQQLFIDVAIPTHRLRREVFEVAEQGMINISNPGDVA